MFKNRRFISIPRVASYYRANSFSRRDWRLRWKPVCASTEIEISKWISDEPHVKNHSIAFFSDKQNYGKGQRNRDWESQLGGVWVSALFPSISRVHSIGLLGLSVALGIVERLEMKGIAVEIKWPNDLIINKKKVAGVLPRVISRGEEIKVIRIGLGLNVFNRVPSQGISIAQALRINPLDSSEWAAEVLLSLDRAIELLSLPEFICEDVQRRLWSRTIIDPEDGKTLLIEGISDNGGLIVFKDGRKIVWNRWT